MNVVEWINTNTYVKLELLLFKPDSDTTEKETNAPFFSTSVRPEIVDLTQAKMEPTGN